MVRIVIGASKYIYIKGIRGDGSEKRSKIVRGRTFEFWIKILGASKFKEWLNSWQKYER